VSLLLLSLCIGALALLSEIVMALMTRSRAGSDGVSMAVIAHYYAQ
jgi:hypothetical protein